MMAWRQSVCNLFRACSHSSSPAIPVRNLSSMVKQRVLKHPSFTSGGLLMDDSSLVLCGRGDKKTKKGKRFKGTFGNSRPKKDKRIARIKEKVEVPTSTPWRLPFKLI